MAKNQQSDFSCQTNDKSNSVVDIPCKKTCKVTYHFVFRSKLSMPYAVAVNNEVLTAFKDRPKRTDSKISLTVNAGQTVHLFLNSDAHPAYRQHPVYQVVVGEDDIEVAITEVAGKHTDSDVPMAGKSTKNEAISRTVQHMTAKLTGDIWMKISHRYSTSEVEALLPAQTSAEVIAAVKSIYSVLSKPTLIIHGQTKQESTPRTLTVKFSDSDNPKANITNYALLKDGLTRVHPGGYAALFNAAIEHGIDSLQMTSCWRPMLGSIAHRAGLGLDVGYVGPTKMNRQGLRRSNGAEISNVSNAEVSLFKEYEDSIALDRQAQAELNTAKKASLQSGLSAEEKLRAQQRVQSASRAKAQSADAMSDAKQSWDDERNANEPVQVKFFRASLLKCSCVTQLFDPWFMDVSTKDSLAPQSNMQKTGNETLHAHHLHVTVYEPKIL